MKKFLGNRQTISTKVSHSVLFYPISYTLVAFGLKLECVDAAETFKTLRD